MNVLVSERCCFLCATGAGDTVLCCAVGSAVARGAAAGCSALQQRGAQGEGEAVDAGLLSLLCAPYCARCTLLLWDGSTALHGVVGRGRGSLLAHTVLTYVRVNE